MRKILCASHDTMGARAAEEAAFDLCGQGGSFEHLVVVPDFWKGMMGDDWLNNAATQIRFGNYVEDQLTREIQQHVARLAQEARARNVSYTYGIMRGKPTDCLLEASRGDDYDLVVIGSPRPKGMPGYRSRMKLEQLVRSLKVPLYIVPNPAS